MNLIRLTTLIAASFLAVPVLAGDILIDDAYARASNPRSGAAFMTIRNGGDTEDRLVSVASAAAARVELHSHIESGDGVMKMVKAEEGFAIPAGQAHALARGGDHIMFMGLTTPFEHGQRVTLTLTFQQAGEMILEIPIDLERQDHGPGKGN